MGLISISICLTDIPKDRIKQAANGKKYINLVCAERREVSKYGDTHTVFVSQTKDEREFKVQPIYVGAGKEYVQQAVTAESIESMPPAQNMDDLPF
ncbi:MAG: hypothetical protein LBK58_13090 [Prevotellaceae bacterium]|jgi:hypothetical protein|nr:hypothetical protein [Prevotellaceae bacterium]